MKKSFKRGSAEGFTNGKQIASLSTYKKSGEQRASYTKKSFKLGSIEGFEDGKQIATLSTYKKSRVTLKTKRKLKNLAN